LRHPAMYCMIAARRHLDLIPRIILLGINVVCSSVFRGFLPGTCRVRYSIGCLDCSESLKEMRIDLTWSWVSELREQSHQSRSTELFVAGAFLSGTCRVRSLTPEHWFCFLSHCCFFLPLLFSLPFLPFSCFLSYCCSCFLSDSSSCSATSEQEQVAAEKQQYSQNARLKDLVWKGRMWRVREKIAEQAGLPFTFISILILGCCVASTVFSLVPGSSLATNILLAFEQEVVD
jgi:hypothetical protein